VVLKDTVYLKERRERIEKGGTRWKKEEVQGVFNQTTISFLPLDSEQRRGRRRLGGGRPAAIAGEPDHGGGRDVG
jgi:hypothetical protein